jgi:hypothetical protein
MEDMNTPIICVGKLKGNYRLGDLGADGCKVLKEIFNMYSVKMWAEFF